MKLAFRKTFDRKNPRYHIPNNDVRTLPETADIIFCPSDTSPTPLGSASSARWVAVAILSLMEIAAERRVTCRRRGLCCQRAVCAKRALWALFSAVIGVYKW
jgi:hypothetical protein